MSSETGGSARRQFVRKHYAAIAVFGTAVALAIVGAVFVLLWFVANAQSSGLVPASIGLWTMKNLVDFILNAIFWEFIFIGIPVILGGIAVWQWWKRIPKEEWRGMRFRKRPGKGRGGGGGGLLFFIAFAIKVYLDGNWNVQISTFTVNYLVDSMVLILAIFAIIFGVPAVIFGVWWIRREIKKP